MQSVKEGKEAGIGRWRSEAAVPEPTAAGRASELEALRLPAWGSRPTNKSANAGGELLAQFVYGLVLLVTDALGRYF